VPKRILVMAVSGLLAVGCAFASAGAASASVTSPATSAATRGAVSAGSVPRSPDGIYDSRLCGNSNFEVNDGTYVHEFFPEGAVYITGGTQHTWEEQVWWAGIVEVSGYRFVVDCY
jgi:hypothetical protein